MSYSNPRIDAVFDGIEARILQELDKAKFSIQIAMAWWTNRNLATKIIEKSNQGIQIDAIVCSQNPFFINQYPKNLNIPISLIESGVTLLSYNAPNGGKFHHKYCIIDEQKVLTGSFNWTNRAENNNVENIVVIKDKAIVDSYLETFNKLILRAEIYESDEILPYIQFRPRLFFGASKKFVEIGEDIKIYWNIHNADFYALDEMLESDESSGMLSTKLYEDTTLTIKAQKGEEEITKHLQIRLFKEPSFELAVYTKSIVHDEWELAQSFSGFNGYHIFEGQSVQLKWYAENVDRLLIDGQEHDVSQGVTGIHSDASKTIVVEAFNRDRRTEQEINIYVTPIPKFDIFKTPISDPLEFKAKVEFSNVTIPSTLELLDTPLISKVNFPTIQNLKTSILHDKPTIKLTPKEDIKVLPPYNPEPVFSKTAYIKPSFRESWKKHLKANKQIINHIKQLFIFNGK